MYYTIRKQTCVNLCKYTYKFLHQIDLEIPSTKTRFKIVYFQITIIVHLITFAFDVSYWPLLMYIRNQLIGLSFLCSCIQILDFLSFHHLFGPWAIIISSLVVDTLKFLVVLMIFEVGFTMMFLTMNQPYYLLGKFGIKGQVVYFIEGRSPSRQKQSFFI